MLTSSLDGKVCGEGKTLRFCPGAMLTVADFHTGEVRTWLTNAAERIESLSWAADRRTIGYVVRSEVQVFDTAPPGDTLAAARAVVPGTEATAAAISPEGHSMLVGRTRSDGQGTHRYTIDEYAVFGGRWIRTLFGAGRQGTTMPRWDSIHYDRTGRRVLIGSDVHALTRLDNGQATTVGGRPLVAAW